MGVIRPNGSWPADSEYVTITNGSPTILQIDSGSAAERVVTNQILVVAATSLTHIFGRGNSEIQEKRTSHRHVI